MASRLSSFIIARGAQSVNTIAPAVTAMGGKRCIHTTETNQVRCRCWPNAPCHKHEAGSCNYGRLDPAVLKEAAINQCKLLKAQENTSHYGAGTAVETNCRSLLDNFPGLLPSHNQSPVIGTPKLDM